MSVLELRRSKPKPKTELTTPNLISIWGPIGSPGKTTLALNLAFELAQNKRVLLVDLDTHAPSLASYLNLPGSPPGLAAVARLIRQGRLTPEELQRLTIGLNHKRLNLRLLPGLNNPNRWTELTPDTVTNLIRIAALDFDFIIFDLASDLDQDLTSANSPIGRNSVSQKAIDESNIRLSLLAESKLHLERYLRIPQANQSLIVLNKSTKNPNFQKTLTTLSKQTIYAHIPEDHASIQLAESQGLPLGMARRQTPARVAIAALANKLLG